VHRSAILLDPSNTMFNLQVERVVHCTGNDNRRLFKNADELHDWLDGGLTEAEREALRAFLSDDMALFVGKGAGEV
jgi:predicted oxidoreductase (fatty acid repression mutant protein)